MVRRQKTNKRDSIASTEPNTNLSTIIDVGGLTQSQSKPKENTRSELANTYVKGFLGIVLIAMLYSLARGYSPNDTKDMLITISGILSGPLGFIIGYYFKTDAEGKK